ncbi:Tachykinin receptor [Chamberlinius hualienensis]
MDVSHCANFSNEFVNFSQDDANRSSFATEFCRQYVDDDANMSTDRSVAIDLHNLVLSACNSNNLSLNEVSRFFHCLMDNNPVVYESDDNVSDTLPLPVSNFTLPFWHQLLWTVVFGVMIVMATGGNLIVIWIVLGHQRMRSVTNYFLVNLSVADIMVSTLNVIFNLVFMVTGNWPFGDTYCKFSNFVAVVSVAASVFTMMAISLDR